MSLRIQNPKKPKEPKKEQPKTPVVYGDRICPECKGICHEDSYRAKYGERKRYYCSESCLRRKYKKRLEEHFKKSGYRPDDNFWTDPRYLEKVQDYINEFERVDCITA